MVKNLSDLYKRFPDEASCREFLIQQRWNGVPVCPYCGHNKSYRIEGGKRLKCANKACYKKYSVTVGTIYEDSNISFKNWFVALYFATSHKKGISSVQLAKHLGVTQKTAWFMLHRIRESLREKAPLILEGEVQVDEVYVGGAEGNKHKNKRLKTSGKGEKMPIVGMVETGGRIVTQVMPWVTQRNVSQLFQKHLHPTSEVVSDKNPVYFRAAKKHSHVIINHAEGQFKVGLKHTNSIENYWSLLNRGIYGIYHHVSSKHLQRYCDEFAYRYNSRKITDGFRWALSILQIEGRLKYVDLIHGKDIQKEGTKEITPIQTGE